MTYNEDLELEDEPRERRYAVFPTVVVPARVGALGSAAVAGAALLEMVSALIKAVSYREPNPVGLPSGTNPGGLQILRPAFGFGDRMSLFTSSGADLTVALLIAVAAAVLVMTRSGQPADRLSGDLHLPVLVVTAALASVVVVANVIMGVVVLEGTSGLLVSTASANKASSVISLLASTLIAAGALVYVITRLLYR